MNAEDRDLLLEAIALVKQYEPTSPRNFIRKRNVIRDAYKRLNRRRTWWQKLTKRY